MRILVLFTCVTIFFLPGCKKDRLIANGNQITEVRSPGQFTGINTGGNTPVQITYGTEFKVELKGSDNLIPYFKTNITNGTLYLGYEKANVKNDDIQAYITLPLLRLAALNGSGKIDIEGDFPTVAQLKLVVNGSGNIHVKNRFETEESLINISGSGKIDLLKVESKKAEVNISGSGDASLTVQHNLTANISGSGNVYYNGTPDINAHASGSGKVIKL